MRLDHLLSKGREVLRGGDSGLLNWVVLILEGLELVSWFDLGDSVRCRHNLLNRGIVFMLGIS